MLRIGITGSHGTGKTTLAESLAERLNLPLIEEQARLVAQMLKIESVKHLKDQPEMGARFQWGCLFHQIKAESGLDTFISDRTTIDNTAYWMKHHAHNWPSETSNTYYRRALGHVSNYDLIIYVPPEITPVDDGFRGTNKDQQIEIDTYIRAFLALTEPNFITVRGSNEERVDRVIRELYRPQKVVVH